MNMYHHKPGRRHGMTLVEVLVTLSVLSLVLAGSLSVYSSTYKTLRTRDALMNVIDDTTRIMATLGDDIRQAQEFLPDYHSLEFPKVIVALKSYRPTNAHLEERLVLYSLDNKHPNRLIRSVITSKGVTSLQISAFIQNITILPKTDNLLEISLSLKAIAAGQPYTLQTSTVYALRS